MDADSLLRAADLAMYTAKHSGIRYAFSDPQLADDRPGTGLVQP